MPTYEYECLKCSHKFEASQGITAPPLKKCPLCGKAVKRLISAGAGIIFKGSGFYATDYRSKGYQESAKSENVSCSAATKACSSSGCPKAK
ncbi:MAG: zinc ribbon domain-containing protein [Candidatus Omnitrophota bacterium]|nr:zinc ribbon domain-containing protein [Candidatus Omnitrophota bacterium]